LAVLLVGAEWILPLGHDTLLTETYWTELMGGENA
jgi:hypothetical protein